MTRKSTSTSTSLAFSAVLKSMRSGFICIFTDILMVLIQGRGGKECGFPSSEQSSIMHSRFVADPHLQDRGL